MIIRIKHLVIFCITMGLLFLGMSYFSKYVPFLCIASMIFLFAGIQINLNINKNSVIYNGTRG